MANAVRIAAINQVRQHGCWFEMMVLGQEFGEQVGVGQVFARGLREVEFDAIARAQDRGLATITSGQIGQRQVALGVGKRQPFAQLHARGPEADADGDEVHRAASPAANGCEATSVTSISPNAAMVSSASRRAGTCTL